MTINHFAPESREWFSGLPVFRDMQGRPSYAHPQNTDEIVFHRELNTDGSFYWCYNGEPWLDKNGVVVQDTEATWGFTEAG